MPENWIEKLRKNYAAVQTRITTACEKAGRSPNEIKLIWVSKNHPQEAIQAAYEVGGRIFGENRVQEALKKFPLPNQPTEIELHLIGTLQRNKVRKILPLVSCIHSVDSLQLLQTIDRISGEMGKKTDLLLQVNTSEEVAKSGIQTNEIEELIMELPSFLNISIKGLMTIGPMNMDAEKTRQCFQQLRQIRDDIRKMHLAIPTLQDFGLLSMGMTHDLEIAIEEGADFIRIGTALFGERQ